MQRRRVFIFTMTDSQPKFKFKKRNKASLKNKRLRRAVDDEDATTTKATKKAIDSVAEAEVVPGEVISSAVKVEDDNATSSPSAVEHDGDDVEEPSALKKILAVERRRKLLGVVGRSRGVDTANLGKSTTKMLKRVAAASQEQSLENNAEALAENKDLQERLQVNFAGGKLAGSNDMGGDDEGGILAKKHRRAMEDYIAQNLNDAAESGDGVGGSGNNGSIEGEVKNKASEAEKEMYAELLTSDAAQDDASNNPPDIAAGEGDVGAGGAMMGGTGIAEVALPIDERIRALKETERAAAEHERARRAARSGATTGGDKGGAPRRNVASAAPTSLEGMVPVNFASGPGKRKRQEDVGSLPVASDPSARTISTESVPAPADRGDQPSSSALPPSSLLSYSASSAGPSVRKSDVSALGASYSHNFQLHTNEWVSRKRDERQVEIDAVQAQHELEEGPNPECRARMGFEMSRKLARGEAVAPPPGASGGAQSSSSISGRGPNGESLRNDWDRKRGGNPHSNDDRVWRTFMSKQRNRR